MTNKDRVLVLVGPIGSGKSTLADMVSKFARKRIYCAMGDLIKYRELLYSTPDVVIVDITALEISSMRVIEYISNVAHSDKMLVDKKYKAVKTINTPMHIFCVQTDVTSRVHENLEGIIDKITLISLDKNK